MIQKIIFSKSNSLNSELVVIELDKHINVIIGPKGGGKSTLFDLIAGLKENYIAKNVIDALAEHNLKFEKAIKFTNEEINFNQLTKKNEKEKIENYKNRFDVIYQDDPIKKNLNSASEIQKEKYKILKEKINSSDSVNNLITNIEKFYNSMIVIDNMNKIDINWTNTFQMSSATKDDELAILTKLNYQSMNLNQIIENEKNKFKNILLDSTTKYKNILMQISKWSFNEQISNIDFENNLANILKITLENLEQINILTKDRIIKLEQNQKMIISFEKAYKKMIDNIKRDNFKGSGLKSYEVKAEEHFKTIASEIIKMKKIFSQTINHNQNLIFENNSNNDDGMTYRINPLIKLNLDNMISLLKIVLFSPGNDQKDITKWLKEVSKKGIKEFDRNKLINNLTKQLEDEIKVYVDGKDYETLSLGQKSIYGLKFKFKKSINDDLFLDQPEDNLDNNTIAQEVVQMLKKKRLEQQIIIVTHNANIGILVQPQKIIVANLQENIPYKIGTIKKYKNESESDSDSAHYLEGGSSSLEKRFNIIIKGEK